MIISSCTTRYKCCLCSVLSFEIDVTLFAAYVEYLISNRSTNACWSIHFDHKKHEEHTSLGKVTNISKNCIKDVALHEMKTYVYLIDNRNGMFCAKLTSELCKNAIT